jgi:hypothetical protein
LRDELEFLLYYSFASGVGARLKGVISMKQIIIGIVLFLHCGLATAFSYTLELPEAELQTRAEAMMSLEKKKFFITIILTNPEVDLISST